MSTGGDTTFLPKTAHLPSAVLGDPPVSLRYYDTQPGRSQGIYTTIIAEHGMAFNSLIWKSWVPYLSNNIRLLAFNRRGYEGSSEPHVALHPSADQVEAQGRYILDLLGFMRFAVDDLGIPKREKDGQSGGIVLLSWSKGTSADIGLLSFLSDLPILQNPPFHLPSDLTPFYPPIASHLRCVILYDPPCNFVGCPLPPEVIALQSLPPLQVAPAFGNWLKGTVPPQALPMLEAAYEELSVYHDGPVELGASIGDMRVVALRAFKPVPSSTAVALIHGTNTIPLCSEAAAWLEGCLRNQRNAAVRGLGGEGHFAMVTDPKRFAACVEELIVTLSAKDEVD